MTKTMSIRMDRENLEFLNEFTREQKSDLSKAVRDMVTRGRILLAVERYKKGEASLGRAAELAGLPLGQLMTILTEFGVKGRLEREDYLQGLTNLKELGELSFENTRWFLLVDFRDVEICRRRRTNAKRNQRFVQS